jgi:superoxide reductase
MRRRKFLSTAAGVGAATLLAGRLVGAEGKAVEAVEASEEKPAEKRAQVYKCERCGTVVEVLVPGSPTLVHCGKPMKLMPETTEGVGASKHVPVIEKIEGGYRVKVGASAHPMTEAHHIVWIDLIANGTTQRAYLQPGGKPEATFMTAAEKVSARAYCNLHGLWKSKG